MFCIYCISRPFALTPHTRHQAVRKRLTNEIRVFGTLPFDWDHAPIF